MKRLTTTFQGMEFIKILLEALGWNAFSPCKTELQHQSPVAELMVKLRNIRLWRGSLQGHQLFRSFSRAGSRDSTRLGRERFLQTLGHVREWKPRAPTSDRNPPGAWPGASGGCLPPPPHLQAYRAPAPGCQAVPSAPGVPRLQGTTRGGEAQPQAQLSISLQGVLLPGAPTGLKNLVKKVFFLC